MVNKDYLKEFCNTYNIFEKGKIPEQIKSLIAYNFGIKSLHLKNVRNISQLEKAIDKNMKIPSELEKDIEEEVKNFYDNIMPSA